MLDFLMDLFETIILPIIFLIFILIFLAGIWVGGTLIVAYNTDEGQKYFKFSHECRTKSGKILFTDTAYECWYPGKDGPVKINELRKPL